MLRTAGDRKNSLLTASTSWGPRGQERGVNKHRNTRPEIPAEREKHKVMTAMMSCVHGE